MKTIVNTKRGGMSTVMYSNEYSDKYSDKKTVRRSNE
jgi:hypothetical protein